MKVLFVCGSPRKDGNTSDVMRIVHDEVAERYDSKLFYLAGEPLRGSRNFYPGREAFCGRGKDKVAAILHEVVEADVLVYGSPLHCHTFSVEMNAFLDRHFELLDYVVDQDPWARGNGWFHSLVAGKKAGLIITCQGPIEGNADLLMAQFDRFCGRMQLDLLGKYVFPWAPFDNDDRHWNKDGLRQIVDDVEQVAQYL